MVDLGGIPACLTYSDTTVRLDDPRITRIQSLYLFLGNLAMKNLDLTAFLLAARLSYSHEVFTTHWIHGTRPITIRHHHVAISL